MKQFLISDLHYGDAYMIRHCNRPFHDVYEMDRTIIHNWNRVVDKRDIVYFLGDFAHHKADELYRRLNGNIIFILGNHDGSILRHKLRPVFERMVITHNGESILLVHNPCDHGGWNGWIIHGHTHNHQITRYPRINNKYKTMNVSCELINYTPIELEKLFDQRMG